MITNITIDNFRQFDHLEVKDLKRINFLVGKNNCGKTTVLEALYIMGNPQNHGSWAKIAAFRGMNVDPKFMSYAFRNLQEDIIKLSIKIDKELCELTIAPKIENIIVYTSPQDENNQAKTEYNYNITTTKNNNKQVYPALLSIGEKEAKLVPIKTFLNPYGMGNFLSDRLLMVSLSPQIQDLFKKSPEEEDKVNSLVKLFNKNILKVSPLGNDVYIDTKNVEIEKAVRLPLALMGDGIKKFLAIICALLDGRLRHICIDEIENGLHFETQKTLLRAILRLSKAKNIQMFITTHSYETLKFLSEIMQEDEFNTQQDDVQVINIANTIKKGYISTNYFTNEVQNLIENESEIRG